MSATRLLPAPLCSVANLLYDPVSPVGSFLLLGTKIHSEPWEPAAGAGLREGPWTYSSPSPGSSLQKGYRAVAVSLVPRAEGPAALLGHGGEARLPAVCQLRLRGGRKLARQWGPLRAGRPLPPAPPAFPDLSSAALKGLSLPPNKGLFRVCSVLICLSCALFGALSRAAERSLN